MPQSLLERIQALIRSQGGWIGFDQFMAQALYAPGLGYYSGAGNPFGDGGRAHGDFQTAPMMGPWLAKTIWKWSLPLWQAMPPRVLEFGAGRGDLAGQLLRESAAGHAPLSYEIVELSGVLRGVQRQSTQGLGPVRWHEALPTGFCGLVLANEVLDAMPVRRFEWAGPDHVLEWGVGLSPAGSETPFSWQARSASPDLHHVVTTRAMAAKERGQAWTPGYCGEWRPLVEPWLASLFEAMDSGAVLLIDYGYAQSELDHPGRSRGTLCGHRAHRRVDDEQLLLAWVGEQDLTAHVDFSQLAQAARAAGFDVTGFVTQARFLINAGLLELAQAVLSEQSSTIDRVRLTHELQRLLSEAEMGEVFKVMLLTKGLAETAVSHLVESGFSSASRLAQL